MHKSHRQAFTLVELIIVIVILSILSTIAFLSFNSYSSSTRDSVRLSDISNIAKWLVVQYSIWWNYIIPDNSINIYSWSTVIWYQWKVWSNNLNIIKLSTSNNNSWKDPLDNTYYTYNINSTKNRYQVTWYLESKWSVINRIGSINNWDEKNHFSVISSSSRNPFLSVFWDYINRNNEQTLNNRFLVKPGMTLDELFSFNLINNLDLINQTNATNYTNRYPYTKWDSIWVILNYTWWTNSGYTIYTPIEDSWTWIDITNTWQTVWKIVIDDNSTSSTWVNVNTMSGYVTDVNNVTQIILWTSSSNPWLSCNDIKIQSPSAIDWIYWVKPDTNPTFQVYCDMTIDWWGWTLIMNLDTNDWNVENYNSAYWYDTSNYWTITNALTWDYKSGSGFNIISGTKFMLKVHQEWIELAHTTFNINELNKTLYYFFNKWSNIQLTSSVISSVWLTNLNASEPTIKQNLNIRLNSARGNADYDRVSIWWVITDNMWWWLWTRYDWDAAHNRPYNDGQLLNCSWVWGSSCTIWTDIAWVYAWRNISSWLQYDYAFYVK